MRKDFLASIVVFLVALPLCMGIAIASGVPVAAGLITGIVGGLVVGVFAGAPLQVSGPAAGLTVIVYEIVRTHGLEVLGIVVAIAGLLQIVAGTLRLGQWFRAVSPAVINGMLAGIGVLIFASQFHVMVDDEPKENGVQNLLTIPQAIAKGLPWPELGTRPQREYRAESLQKIGALHEQQVQVWETVAEHVSAVSPGGELVLDGGDLDWLLERQRHIREGLTTIVEDLRAHDLLSPDRSGGEVLRAAALAAQDATTTALEQLEAGHGGKLLTSQADAAGALASLSGRLKNHAWAAKIGFLTILVIVGWDAFLRRRIRSVPAPLVAVVVATVLAMTLKLPVLYVELPDRLLEEIHIPTLSLIQRAPWVELLTSGIVVALVASAETLLCATAVDQMHTGPRTKYDRELAAQGVGNTICGLLGALPMTGVIVRSAANINAGARSRLSAILHGLWLLLFVAILPFVLRNIPTASLAAILVYTGYKLMTGKKVKQLAQYGKSEVAIFFITVVMIVVTDLLTGVLVGVALSAAKLLYTFSHLVVQLEKGPKPGQSTLHLNGSATFIRLPQLAAALEQVEPNTELHVHFEGLSYIDHACLDLLMNWEKQHQATGGRLMIDWGSLTAKFNGQRGAPSPAAAEPIVRRQTTLAGKE